MNHETGQNSSSEESENSSAIETVTGLPSFGLDITGLGDPEARPVPGSSRLYITTTSLPDFDVREPGVRRSMSGTMTSSSRSKLKTHFHLLGGDDRNSVGITIAVMSSILVSYLR
jgi:hypothetical protein